MKVLATPFGKLPDGRHAMLYTLNNNSGLILQITNYGGIITGIEIPDKDGTRENVVLGFSKLEDYFANEYLSNYPYFGAIVGRYCNRISKGHLSIQGKSYPLVTNNGENHLHGGNAGFDKKLWDAIPFEDEHVAGIKLTCFSPHLEENYPGNLEVACTYTLNSKNELHIEYEAITDEPTVVNLTNHTYFNLTAGKENIQNHELKLAAERMTELSGQIPTGTILSTLDSPFDFREFKTIGKEIKKLPFGYDDNFILDNEEKELKYAGTLREKLSGRLVEIYTTQPALQVYSGYWIPELVIDGEHKFGRFSGVALETQHYPDSPNHPNFPSTLLSPEETYREKTVYKFGIMEK